MINTNHKSIGRLTTKSAVESSSSIEIVINLNWRTEHGQLFIMADFYSSLSISLESFDKETSHGFI